MTMNTETESTDEAGDFSLAREIIIGTYEDYVIGYTVETSHKKRPIGSNGVSKKNSYSLEQSFAVRAHSGSVRCLASSQDGSFTFSAGFDEMFNLFGLKKRKLLHTMEGAFNCATFVDKSYLICGSEADGNILIYQCKNSSITKVKTLVGHRLPVTSLSVHPSGKLLLSISKDNTMRTWNLIKGRQAYVSSNVKPHAHLIKWSKSGEEFVIAVNDELYLYNNSTGKLMYTIKLEKRVSSIEFITQDLFIVATDSGILEFFNLNTGEPLAKHKAHETRIKSLKVFDELQDKDEKASQAKSDELFVTASSDGQVKLWSVNVADKSPILTPIEISSIDTGARLTCMTTATYKC